MTESPSLLLQRAAELIEQRAAAVDRDDLPVIDGSAAWTDLLCMFGPDTAAPLVALLRDAAHRAEKHSHLNPDGSTYQRCALDLARAVLGLPSRDEEE